MCSLRCYGTPDLRFGRVTLILFGVERFCVLYLRVSSFCIFIGYFRGVVTARDRCANADWTVKFLRIIGTKTIVKLIESDFIIFRSNWFNLEIKCFSLL